MDWQKIEENWTRFRRAIKEKWGKLTEDDLKTIAGRRTRLEETLHKRYGFAPDYVRKEVEDWLRWQNPKAGEPKLSDRANRLRDN
jgi:uncharacterized protein YjbJ (UPF0337 family)